VSHIVCDPDGNGSADHDHSTANDDHGKPDYIDSASYDDHGTAASDGRSPDSDRQPHAYRRYAVADGNGGASDGNRANSKRHAPDRCGSDDDEYLHDHHNRSLGADAVSDPDGHDWPDRLASENN